MGLNVSEKTKANGPTKRQFGVTGHRAGLLALAACLMLVTAVLLDFGPLRMAMFFASGLLGVGSFIALIASWRLKSAQLRAVTMVQNLFEGASDVCFVSSDDGHILYANDAASDAGMGDKESLTDVLADQLLDAEGKVRDMIATCQLEGHCDEEVSLRDNMMRLSVKRVETGVLVWEIQKSTPVSEAHHGSATPRLPMLTVGRSGAVLFINPAARHLLGERKKTLSDIFGPNVTDLQSATTVHTSDGEQQCLVAEFDATAGRREIYLLPTETPVMRDGAVQFDELPVALLKVSPKGDVLLANRAARQLIQMDIASQTVMGDLMEGLGRSIVDWLMEAAQGKTVNQSEFLRLKREDKEVIVQVSLNRVLEGGEVSLIAVLSDATELKSLEAQFVQSQKCRRLASWLGVLRMTLITF